MGFKRDLIIGCIQSWYDITTRIILRQKKRVIFAAPQHFNRDANGKNPFFEEMIKTCEQCDVSYLLLESPEYGAPQPHNQHAVRIDFIFWLMMLLYKIASKIYRKDNRKTTKVVTKVINFLTLGKLQTSVYITLAGLFIEIFQEMNPNATVYDLQHGIIYRDHPGYFDSDKSISSSLDAPNCKILLWGNGFKDLFRDLTKNLSDKTIVIGYPIKIMDSKSSITDRKTVLFSLQFTHDVSEDVLLKWKDMLDDALSMIDYSRYTIKLKHHPRFNNVIDLTDLQKKYPYIIFTNDALQILVEECILNITWASTTCFEFAFHGIPTFILSDSRYKMGSTIYYNQFNYPVFEGLTLPEVFDIIEEPTLLNDVMESLKRWHSRFFSPLNKRLIGTIIKKK